jgi:phosphatidylglycerophosphatase A
MLSSARRTDLRTAERTSNAVRWMSTAPQRRARYHLGVSERDADTARRVSPLPLGWLSRRITIVHSTAPSGLRESAPTRSANGLAYVLSLWFGCGLVPFAPGTAGTLGALPLYLWVRPYGLVALAATAVGVTALGVWSSTRVASATGLHDPQFVCVDEVAGVLVTWLAAPEGWKGTLAGFVLFRFFDWTKPYPARALERLPGGFGIVCDDLAAGAWGAAALLALRAAGVL